MRDHFYKNVFCCSNSKNLSHFITFYSLRLNLSRHSTCFQGASIVMFVPGSWFLLRVTQEQLADHLAVQSSGWLHVKQSSILPVTSYSSPNQSKSLEMMQYSRYFVTHMTVRQTPLLKV